MAHKVNVREYQGMRLKLLAELSEETEKLRFYILVIRQLCNSLTEKLVFATTINLKTVMVIHIGKRYLVINRHLGLKRHPGIHHLGFFKTSQHILIYTCQFSLKKKKKNPGRGHNRYTRAGVPVTGAPWAGLRCGSGSLRGGDPESWDGWRQKRTPLCI